MEIYTILRRQLYDNATYVYLMNLAVADLVKCLFVLPVSITTLLLQNWIFGSFMCYFVPMLQDVPTHVTILTLLLIAYDRYNYLKKPARKRLPALIFSTGCWLTAICVVLPYPIYTTYIDLSVHLNTNAAIGICLFNLDHDIQEYSRVISALLFLTPVLGICYFLMQMSETIINVRPIQSTRILSPCHYRYGSSSERTIVINDPNSNDDTEMNSCADHHTLTTITFSTKLGDRRIAQFFIIIFLIFIFCYGSFLILRYIHQRSEESYIDSAYWDTMYAVVMWLAYVPTTVTPALVLIFISKYEINPIAVSQNYILMKPCRRSHSVTKNGYINEGLNVNFSSRPSAVTVSTELEI